MTNIQLQELLAQHPDDMPIRIMVSHFSKDVFDFDTDHVMKTSETAYVNPDAPEDEWDTEDGKVELGDGQQFLLINPIIL